MSFLAHMNHCFYKLLETFRLFITKKVEGFGAHYYEFGLFGILNYPSFYFIWKYYNNAGYESFLLRSIATLLSFLLLIKGYWPKLLKPWLPIYWYFTLLFCLPFFFFFMLFMNGGSAIWLMSSNTIICWLLFIVDLPSAIFIVSSGVLLAYIAFLIVTPQFIFSFEKSWGLIAQYVASFSLACIFVQKKHQFNEKKLHAMQTLATSLAHEIRTPLASLTASIEGIKPYWSTLVDSYRIAKTVNKQVTSIPASQLDLLEKSLHRMQREVDFTNTIINMLLVNVSLGKLKIEQMTHCSINYCVDQALQRYPFSDVERQLVRYDSAQNFFFRGSDILLIHVLFNLIKNALYHIKAANKGSIHIWIVDTMHYHQLHFRDTGAGISARLMPYIFEHFFSKTYHGSGIGLTFCKVVMESFSGTIECCSIEKEYAEFILKFPKMHLMLG
jgi:signal transduction histidine kinase